MPRATCCLSKWFGFLKQSNHAEELSCCVILRVQIKGKELRVGIPRMRGLLGQAGGSNIEKGHPSQRNTVTETKT